MGGGANTTWAQTGMLAWDASILLNCLLRGACDGVRGGGGEAVSQDNTRPAVLHFSHPHLLFLVLLHLGQKILGNGVVGEVGADRLQEGIESVYQGGLELLLGDLSGDKVGTDSREVVVGRAVAGESGIGGAEDDILNIVQARVLEVILDEVHRLLSSVVGGFSGFGGDSLRLRGTVGGHDFPSYVLHRVFHENGRVGVGLAHLLLTSLQTEEHVVGQNDGLELDLGSIAVLPRQHVHLPLVHSQLAHVGLQEEDVSTLHERVQDLRS